MENAILTTVLPEFVSQVSRRDSRHDRPLTINDLRMSIRSERMSETRDWSDRHLDVIEVHAAQLDGNAPLEHIFNLPSEIDEAAYAASVSSICSPSPFAWT